MSLLSHFHMMISKVQFANATRRYFVHSSRRYTSAAFEPFDAKLSYRNGASSVPLVGTTVSRLVDKAADFFGDERLAVIVPHQNIRKNFTQLREEVDRLATGLLSLGLKPHSRVGIWAPNVYEWILSQFATARAGIILVNINPAYQSRELEYCLNKVEVSAMIAAESFKSQNYYELFANIVPEVQNSKSKRINSKRLPKFKSLIMLSDKDHVGAYRFNEVMSSGGKEERDALSRAVETVQMDDPVNIQFTSGTTGNPKGVTLSHHNIVNNSYFVGRRIGYHEEHHRIAISVPLYHCMGCVLGSMNVLVNGACAVLPSPSFDAEASLRAIHTEKCTSIYGTPTMFVDMLNHRNFSQYGCSSLKTGIMSGAPCPEELIKQVVAKMCAKDFITVYGLTETSPVVIAGKREDDVALISTRIGSALDHVELKIVDQEGKIVPVGTPGELLVRGYMTMLCYWNDEAKTREAITAEGWYRTGDLLVMYEDGYAQVVGRIKDMIIRGGENIYPREIEDFLHTHSKIAEAHVVGIPDKRLGEEVCTWIRLKDNEALTEEEVKSFCKGQISHFKIPRYIRFVKNYPMTITGKVQKFVIRDEMISLLKSKE